MLVSLPTASPAPIAWGSDGGWSVGTRLKPATPTVTRPDTSQFRPASAVTA